MFYMLRVYIELSIFLEFSLSATFLACVKRVIAVPAGLVEQIDDLDKLLDRLLKLPIERATSAPAILTLPPTTGNTASVETEHSDSATSVLAFQPEQQEQDDSAQQPAEGSHDTLVYAPQPTLHITTTQQESLSDSQIPVTHQQQYTSAGSATQVAEMPAAPHVTDMPGREQDIPWLADEPLLKSTPVQGPLVEIIHGPTSQTFLTEESIDVQEARPFATRRSWLFWVFWTCTWCFDNTLGHWFPWLRRPGSKLALGLLGAGLCAVSIYLTWIARR